MTSKTISREKKTYAHPRLNHQTNHTCLSRSDFFQSALGGLTLLCVVAGRHEEIGEDKQLVIRELLLVLLPVVMVCPSEIR